MFIKKLNEIKVGIAISTFTESKTEDKRYEIIKKSLDSLQEIINKTKINTYVVIVVDGQVPLKHLNIIYLQLTNCNQ